MRDCRAVSSAGVANEGGVAAMRGDWKQGG